MQLHFSTNVATPRNKVLSSFDRALFEKLIPQSLPVKVIHFEGLKDQDKYHLKLGLGAWLNLPNFIIGKNSFYDWKGRICNIISDDDTFGFVDEATVLPLPFLEWGHSHIFKKHSEYTTTIIDDIHFKCIPKLSEKAIMPAILTLFAYRKMIYIREFGRV